MSSRELRNFMMDRVTELTSSSTPAGDCSWDDSGDLFVDGTPKIAEVKMKSPRKSRQSMGLVVGESDDEDDENFNDGGDQGSGFNGLREALNDISNIHDEPVADVDEDVQKNEDHSTKDLNDSSFIGNPPKARRRILVSSDEEDEEDKGNQWTLHRSRASQDEDDSEEEKKEEAKDESKDPADEIKFDSDDEDVAPIGSFSPDGGKDGLHEIVDIRDSDSEDEVDNERRRSDAQDEKDESFVVRVDSEEEDDVRRGDDDHITGDESTSSHEPLQRPVPTKRKTRPFQQIPEDACLSPSSNEGPSPTAVELEKISVYLEKQETLLRQLGRSLPDKGEKIKAKIAELADRQAMLVEIVAAEKKEQRRKQRGYDEAEVFLVDDGSSGASAGNVSQDSNGKTSDEPLVNASKQPAKVDPQALYGKVGPQRKVVEHLLAADPNQHKLFGGRMNEARHNEVRSVTHDTLYELHEALKSMPIEGADDSLVEPKRLKAPLMVHQRHAVTWGLWREAQNPPGGILADDMGLGKTYTMIALAIKSMELDAQNRSSDAPSKESSGWLDARELRKAGLTKSETTLIVCPASCMGQWENEIKSKVSRHPQILQYHGAARKKASPRTLASYEFVITTYKTVQAEIHPRKELVRNDSPLLAVAWYRIILDEAHVIRNPKSQTADAICKLRATRRWCLTGTPIHNKELDMFSLLKFMRMAPFDEYEVWKRFVDNGSQAGSKRLNLLVKAILLRRTKDQVDPVTGKHLVTLPPRDEQLHTLELSEPEVRVHEQILAFSKSTLKEFLEDKDDVEGLRKLGSDGSEFQNNPYIRICKSKGNGVKLTEILVMLLRLRQICCHPNLLWNILNDSDIEAEAQGTAGVDHTAEDQLMAGLQKMSLGDNSDDVDAEARRFFSKDNPIFDEKYGSTKIGALLKAVNEVPEDDKIVIVSQWASMLDIIDVHLKRAGIRTVKLTGAIPVVDRTDIVTRFNSASTRLKVMLLSLTAGGVGLNLIGGNHLFLVDVHWNPQLEAQACDRIYRVGQKKPVFIHRFVCKDTIEEKIRAVQAKKLALADGVLTGAKKVGSAKLTINDIIELFSG